MGATRSFTNSQVIRPVDRQACAKAFIVACVAFAGSCADTTAIEETGQTSVPPRFAVWWNELSQCLGVSAPFERITWSIVGGSDFPCATGRCAAIWHPGHRITLAANWLESELVVKHEMMHDLVLSAGHPSPPFNGPCSAGASIEHSFKLPGAPRLD